MPLQIRGPVTFINGQPTSQAAQDLVNAGFNPSSGQGYGQFLADYNAREASQQQATQPGGDIASALQQLQAQASAPPQVDTSSIIAGAQQAANENAVPRPVLPAALQAGPVQTALGLQPTVELANRYRYNPWWRT